MTQIILNQLWIHTVSDLSQYITADCETVNNPQTLDGEVRAYANGYQRLITGQSVTRTIPLDLYGIAAADWAKLRSWEGQLLMIRAPQGTLMYGTILADDPVWEIADECDVSGTFQELSWNNEV